MSLHQIIYTSCMRGISGGNDGQQIYSYDANFNNPKSDEIANLFSYQTPTLDTGVIMTEDIAQTMPKAFIYREIAEGTYAFAQNTYLGRDYMGSAGRFGNHLSHVVVADSSDIKNYPCEYYGSSMLRQQMDYGEVNNPETPSFLPQPVLETGSAVNVDAVIDFLAIDGRMEILKDMIYAVLAYERLKKRVLICDTTENTILWIAAIEYTLTLRMAQGINFSTYDFAPELSASQICGVQQKGTRYDAESHRLHIVFDLYTNECATFAKDEKFFDFVDTCLSFSYETLREFHSFIDKGYDYNTANERLYSAYCLYTMLSDGVEQTSAENIDKALEFANEYALPSEERRIIEILLSQKAGLISSINTSFTCVMKYILSKKSTLAPFHIKEIKYIIVDKILYEFLHSTSGEDAFTVFYKSSNMICSESGISMATELMQAEHRDKLFNVMQNNTATWKISFLARVICSYVKDKQITIDSQFVAGYIGQTYIGIVKAVYSKNAQSGFVMVTHILDEFSSDCSLLVSMALVVDSILVSVTGARQESANMWKYFTQIMIKHQPNNFTTAYKIFATNKRYEFVNMLYTISIKNTADAQGCKRLFSEHYQDYVLNNAEYSKLYKEQILTDYFHKIINITGDEARIAQMDLFSLISTQKLDLHFADSLVKTLLKDIPYSSLTKENKKFIKTAFEYIYNCLQMPITGKLLLLFIPLVLGECKKPNQLRDSLEDLEILMTGSQADLGSLSQKVAEDYFDWILPNICELYGRKDDLARLYKLFDMPRDISEVFFAVCTRLFLKQSKSQKDYTVFCDYLGFVFEKGTPHICTEIGKSMSKLGKPKIAEVDQTMYSIYGKEKTAIRHWEEIKKVANATNPLLSSITGLFKGKKD